MQEAEEKRAALEAELERQRQEHEAAAAKAQAGARVQGRWSRAVASSAKASKEQLLKQVYHLSAYKRVQTCLQLYTQLHGCTVSL